MKAQSSLLILVGIVSAIMVSWVLMSFSNVSFSERFIKNLGLSRISSYLDFLKGYSRDSLVLSTHTAVKSVAHDGCGLEPFVNVPRNWICNGPTPPSVNEVRFYLSRETNKTLNEYIDNINKLGDMAAAEYTIQNFTCVDYDVDESSVASGENDETFNVGGYGSYINISLDQDTINASNNNYVEIAGIRFWYMYRIFKEWSERNVLHERICGCLGEICGCTTPGFCGDVCDDFYSCAEDAVNIALQDLQNRFDPYVSCSARLDCCYSQSVPCDPTSQPGCRDWEEAPECNRCKIGEEKPLCSRSLEFESRRMQEQDLKRILFARRVDPFNCPTNKCEYWEDTRGAIEATFTCTDNKYLLSVEGGRHLTFSVYAMIKLRAMNCYRFVPCKCGDYDCVDYDCVDQNGDGLITFPEDLNLDGSCIQKDGCKKEECQCCECDGGQEGWCTLCPHFCH